MRALKILGEETTNLHLRLRLATFLAGLAPLGRGASFRVACFRFAGISIGKGTVLEGAPEVTGGGNPAARISIGAGARLQCPLLLDANAEIRIGDRVSISPHVQIITTNHEIGTEERRSGAPLCAPITIEAGAWIAAGVTLLPGVTIGSGAVVAAGSVVSRSVAPNTLVEGVPARWVRDLPQAGEEVSRPSS